MPSELAHFYSRTRTARKVIVVDLGFLGHTIHLVPALWDLHEAYPEGKSPSDDYAAGRGSLEARPLCGPRLGGRELQREELTSGVNSWRSSEGFAESSLTLLSTSVAPTARSS